MIDNKLSVGTMVEYAQRTFLFSTASFGHEEVTSKKIGLIYGTEMHLSHYDFSTIEKYKILDCETHIIQVAQEQDVTEISDETNKK